ncbi:hypothetical protein ORI20_14205 [Mycobacterium sp. CVI_P3]|uniref:Uncharacterized protein n=1 Tax=Mycobacterium pinniadriaticum TaxID=2994102 RepID=A0ABT3SEP8_9MYCO|nr:hypothetical protein [Mycobacterium pinniadriaticum]MCX2931433.1 hypothetical protein [Mycobacterium pinniadriaticum]MCX2937857.1 hypothetical protein [Mycobacterium pinniadriaticum]
MDEDQLRIRPDEFAEQTRCIEVWADRLDAFVAALDAIDADDPFDFCADAWEIWQSAVTADPPPETNPAALIALGGLNAVAHAMTSSTLDYYRTPDARDRKTLAAVNSSLKACLSKLRHQSARWLREGLPAADEIAARSAALVTSLQATTAPGAAPISDAGIVFDKVCALTDAENKRYREAYDRLRRMLNRQSLQRITDESDAVSDVVASIVLDLQASRGSTFDENLMSERTARIRSALLAVTGALRNHREQSVRAATRTFGHGSGEAKAVERLFDDMIQSSFEYRWLSELHEPLQRDDGRAVKYEFTPRRHGEPEVAVHMNRGYMAQFTKSNQWLGRDELTVMSRDPSVLDMIKAIQPEVNSLQGQLDRILYPNVADDVAAVRQLLDRFGGQKGLDALQSAPGASQEPWMPPHLSPRVLSFVQTYE